MIINGTKMPMRISKRKCHFLLSYLSYIKLLFVFDCDSLIEPTGLVVVLTEGRITVVPFVVDCFEGLIVVDDFVVDFVVVDFVVVDFVVVDFIVDFVVVVVVCEVLVVVVGLVAVCVDGKLLS